jgi:Ser/Thr protein kinase RdoA (MazF antagonist)
VDEEVLTGGNVAAEVVRVGGTVRKPATAATAGVEAVLDHLAEVGFRGSPRNFGLDDRGRHTVEFIKGDLVDTLPPLTLAELHEIGRLIRDLHDAMRSFAPPADPQWDMAIPDPSGGTLICHNDLAPWNLVRDGDRWVFIDWDGAGPATPLWDLGYAASSLVPFLPNGDPAIDAPRLRAFVDGYDLTESERREFPAHIAAHTRAMEQLLIRGHQTGQQPWATLYAEGHANHWGPAAKYVETHRDTWLDALL